MDTNAGVVDLANLARPEATFSEAQADATIMLLEERLAELELALEDEGWLRMTMDGDREFSRDGLGRIIAMARLMFLKNPLIGRGVRLKSAYVWGQGVEVTVRDEELNVRVQAWMDDDAHQAEVFGAQAQVLKEQTLQQTGNLFFVMFPNSITGDVKVRTIDVDEVQDVITNPEDRRDIWFYRRRWTQRTFDPDQAGDVTSDRQMEAWYPHIHHTPAVRRPTIGGHPVRWESPVFHVKTGGLDTMRFGVPEYYAGIDWAKAYKSFLEDWATIVRSLSRFAWKMTAKKGKVNSSAERLGSTLRPTSGARETNPPSTAGAAFVHGDGVDLAPISKSGATVDADDARALRLMVASAMDLPDTLLSGDVDQGNLATAKTLDRPTELWALMRQELWRYVYRTLIGYQIDQWAITGSVPARVARQPGSGRMIVDLVDEEGTTVDITFPPILESDVKAALEAIVMAHGTELVPDEVILRLMLEALGLNDIDEILERLDEMLADQEDRRNTAAQAAVDRFRMGNPGLPARPPTAAPPAPDPGDGE